MKIKHTIYFIVIFYLMVGSLVAQQSPMLTQFMINKNIFNPASIVDGDNICASMFYRSQWLGVDGGPTTTGVNVVMPHVTNNMGLGLGVYSDRVGKYQNIQLEGSYAYSISLDEWNLSLGLRVGVLNKSFSDLNWVTPDTPSGVDTGIVSEDNSSWSPNFGVGAQYFSNKGYLGVSIYNIAELNNSIDEVKIPQKRQYYIMGGYNFKLNSTFELEPNVLVQTDLSSYQIDANLNLKIEESIVVGASYRLQDAVSLLVGFNVLEGLRVFYSYDFGVNKIGSISNSGGSHELGVKYCFVIPNKVKKSKRNRNVRFL